MSVVSSTTSESFPNKSFPNKSFSLTSWLASINCSQYISAFTENGIDEYDLITQLDYGTLKELGVLKVGDLVRFERSLNDMKLSNAIEGENAKPTKNKNNIKQKLSEEFVNKIVNYQIEATRYSRRSSNISAVANESRYSSENENEYALNQQRYSGSDESTRSLSRHNYSNTDDGSTNKRSSLDNLKGSLLNKNHSTSTVSSIESSDSNMPPPTNSALDSLAPIKYMDKHTAVFILQSGKIKKLNTEGCYSAGLLKKKLLKKLNLKPSQHENYNTFFIDDNDNIHLMFDVELVSLVRSSDRVERNRIIFCRSTEDPSSEALATSRAISTRFEENNKNNKKKKFNGDDEKLSANTKYINVNTPTSSQNLRKTLKKKASKDQTGSASFARRNRDMKPLYEQRPPSELISSSIAEYFPETPMKELHQTIKNSVRYSVRMSRAYSRLSMMSIGSSNNTRNSIMNFASNIQNSPRTIGDVWMNNASELDEAVLGDDKEFMDIISNYKRPKSRFVPSGAPPLPELEILDEGKITPISSPSLRSTTGSLRSTTESINSGKKSIKLETSKKGSNKRLSVAINSSDSRDSRIELLDLSSTDSETETGLDDEDPEQIIKDLEYQQASVERNTGPDHWLKGKRIGAGSFGVVYLGLNALTGELMAVKQVEIPDVHELAVSTKSSNDSLTKDNGAKGSAAGSSITSDGKSSLNKPANRSGTLNSDSATLNSNETIQRNDHKGADATLDATSLNNKEKHHKQNMIDALQREMALLKELKHEKIVRYLGSSSDGTFLNIFLEYVPGGSITAMLNNYGPFKEPLIRNFTRQILIGLKYLHSKNIIHRDIKGGNILIDNTGGVKISDFGISKKIETSMQSKRASLQGSVYWMAPEVVRQVTNSEKSDIWSVGCLIIEMFTGRHPFPEFSQMQAIFKIGMHSIPEIPDICTDDCKDFLRKTFIVEYEKRPSAKELLGHAFLNSLIMSEQ